MLPGSFSLHRFLLLVSLIAVFLIVSGGKVRYTNSDPQLTLLSAQALLEEKTLALNSYRNALPEKQFSDGDWKYFNRNGSLFYNYPLGATFLSLPIVAVARRLGMDMSIASHDAALQLHIAALLCVLIVYLLYRLARVYLDENMALLWSLLLFFGSTLISTMGTALWSFGFQLIFLLPALTEVAEVESGKRAAVRPYLLGSFLFMAWLCRPSSLVFLAVIWGWIFLRKDYKALMKSGAVALGLFLLFVIFSLRVFDDLVPPYYNPFRWNQQEHPHGFFFTLTGLLFSPSRGLFVFTPLLLFAALSLFIRDVRRSRLFQLTLLWIVLHTLMLTRNSNWWGGWSYGPRLFTDLLPAFALLLFMSLPHLEKILSPRWLRAGGAAMFIAALFGIYVHTYQGLYNTQTKEWNGDPAIDDETMFYVFNWRYPQFLASEEMNKMKRHEFYFRSEVHRLVPQVPAGAHVLLGAPDAELRVICRRLGKHSDQFNGIKVYNNLADLEQTGAQTFYVHISQSPQVIGHPRLKVVTSEAQPALGDYLEQKENALVLLSVKDEATNALSPASKAYLRAHGAKIDSLDYRQGYILVLDKGKAVQEAFDNGAGAKLNFTSASGKNIELQSLGWQTGNSSSIRVNGQEFSPDDRGFNIVVLDEQGDVRDTLNFDTHAADIRRTNVLKVEWVKKVKR